jgi:hypothetical protein
MFCKLPHLRGTSGNCERISGPSGGSWGPSTINGNARRGTGKLNKELYVGKLTWNRLEYMKNPNTGKRQSRLNPTKDWIVKECRSCGLCRKGSGMP